MLVVVGGSRRPRLAVVKAPPPINTLHPTYLLAPSAPMTESKIANCVGGCGEVR